MSEGLTLEDLVKATAPREKRVYQPQSSEADEQGRFFIIRPNYAYPLGKFSWENQPDLSNYPRRATINSPKRPISDFAPFELAFDGPASEVVDFYDRGPVSFVSDHLLAILREFDPEAIDAVPAPMTCGRDVLGFNAFMPMRALTAANLATTGVEIRTMAVPDKVLATFIYPTKYRLNPEIPDSIDVFADLAEPKMYWSPRLVTACKARGIRGISAQTTYALNVETVEM